MMGDGAVDSPTLWQRRMASPRRLWRVYAEFIRVGFVNTLAYRLRYYTGIVTYFTLRHGLLLHLESHLRTQFHDRGLRPAISSLTWR